MDESTLLLLAGLGVLAWLLAGGWPYVRDSYVADDGPVGLGAGITAVCPGCLLRADAGSMPPLARRTARASAGAALDPATPGLRPLAVGRDHSLRVECPTCGGVYAVLGAPSAVVPAPRAAAD